MDDATSDRLARAYRAGQTDVLPPLVQGLARTLLAQAFRFVRDWDQAADLVQEAWLRAVEAFERWDPARPFAPWVRAILRNLCLQQLARQRRQPVAVSLESAADPTVADQDRPDRHLEIDELRCEVARALAQLPANQRLAVAMIDIECRDHAEVAAALELTPGSLRVILHRGRRALAAILQREDRR